jgi:hypothetical protein
VAVDLVTGSNKNAAIAGGNELFYQAAEKLGSKVIDEEMPGASSFAKLAADKINGLFMQVIKSQTDKVVEKAKEKDKAKK